MKLDYIRHILEAEVLVEPDGWEGVEITTGGGSDLMSDVLTFMKPGSLLLTGQTNPQVIRTAEMADIGAVCFVRGKRPDPETLKIAGERNIPVLYTGLLLYEACGRLYMNGLMGRLEEESVD
jgi:predicted transcriptional regulator